MIKKMLMVFGIVALAAVGVVGCSGDSTDSNCGVNDPNYENC
jgi:hypothetical protein